MALALVAPVPADSMPVEAGMNAGAAVSSGYGEAVDEFDDPPFPGITVPLAILFWLVIFAVCLVLLALGFALGLVIGLALVVCALLGMSAGIVAVSAVVGLVKRRFAPGIRMFHYQACTALAVTAALGLLLMARCFSELPGGTGLQTCLAVTGGTAAGLVFAFVTDRVATFAWQRWLRDACQSLMQRLPTLPSRRSSSATFPSTVP